VLISGENIGQDAGGGGPFLLDFQVQNTKPLIRKMYEVCVKTNRTAAISDVPSVGEIR
jgi:hypothetical protein